MARYKPVDRHLSKLLPVNFAEQIVPGSFEYAVNWLVDHELDLSVFDARYRNDETGAAAYDPAVMLKIVLVGYARGLTSSRSIERACRENVVFMALSGDTQPHFTTIAAFVAKMPTEITSVFRNVLLVCDEQGLIGKELFAVDGCKLPSNASRSWSGTRAELTKKAEKMEKAIAHLLDTHRRQDAGENEDLLQKRERQQIETLKKNSNKIRRWLAGHGEKTNRKGQPLKSNLTDNDSASMKGSHGVIQGYTGVAAVVADTGFRARDPRFAQAWKHKPEEKRRQPGERRSRWFQPKDFQYDAAAQTCICPAGKALKRSGANIVIKGRRGVSFEGSKTICGDCSLRGQCIRKPKISVYRQVTFFDGRKVQETHPHTKAMKARIDTREGRLLYSRRLGIVEPVFGNLHKHRLQRFTLRSRRKVDAQWKLFAIVHNVQKLRQKAP